MEPENTKKTHGFAKGNPGKPKGALNKTTKEAKAAIAMAADKLGGVERLVAWCKEDEKNERIFWGTVYPKLIPVTLAGDAENPIRASLVVEFK